MADCYEAVRAYPMGESTVARFALTAAAYEFDGIVVVQPQEIEDEASTGRATLYVVYTRATQRMTTLTLR